MPDATHDTLREQVRVALRDQDAVHVHGGAPLDPEIYGPLADAVLAVFAERERLLRERIEAMDVNQYSDAARPRVAEFKRRVLALLAE